MHNGYKVCQNTFRFLFGVGKERVKAIQSHYSTNGLCEQIHGNAGRLPSNVTPYEAIQCLVMFICNYAEEMVYCCLDGFPVINGMI